MDLARGWDSLRAEDQEAKAQRMIQEMALDELRAARSLTQEHLAKLLGVKQAAVSKLERRADMYVSTCAILSPPWEGPSKSGRSSPRVTC